MDFVSRDRKSYDFDPVGEHEQDRHPMKGIRILSLLLLVGVAPINAQLPEAAGDGGPALQARVYGPRGLAFGEPDTLYPVDPLRNLGVLNISRF
jgi:hypothetical protein